MKEYEKEEDFKCANQLLYNIKTNEFEENSSEVGESFMHKIIYCWNIKDK